MKYIFRLELLSFIFLNKPYQEIKSFKYRTTLEIRKNTVRFAHVSCDFFSLYLIVFTFTLRSKRFNYKIHWNILVLLEYAPRENVSFCFSSIAWVYFSHKIKKFRF